MRNIRQGKLLKTSEQRAGRNRGRNGGALPSGPSERPELLLNGGYLQRAQQASGSQRGIHQSTFTITITMVRLA